jgi:hypothetical protein
VKEARSPTSELHALFEWDDSAAARKYRLDQARQLISSFEITITINRVEVDVQQFVRDPARSKEQGYVPIGSIKSESEEAREFMSRELLTAKSHVDRCERFGAVTGLTKDVRALSKRLDELSSLISVVQDRKLKQ